MTAGEVQAMLTRLSGCSAGEVDQRTRPLRERDLIPHGPRGVNAPDLEAIHVALFVLCLAARRAVDGGAVAARAMNLAYVPRQGCPIDGPNALAPLVALALLNGSAVVSRIEIAVDGSLAWVELPVEGRTWRLLFADDPGIVDFVTRHPEAYDATGAGAARHWLVLGAGAIDGLHVEFTDVGGAGYAPAAAA